MPAPRRIELDELANRPGTYFNPQTEILVVVDDSSAVDAEIFDEGELEGAEWILISDEVPVDEHARDELLESVAVGLHAGERADTDEDVPDEEDELEPDPDEDE